MSASSTGGSLLRGGGLVASILGIGVVTGLICRQPLATSWSLLSTHGSSASPDRLLVACVVVLAASLLAAVWLWALVAVALCLTEAALPSPPSTACTDRSTCRSSLRSSVLRPRVVRLLVAVVMGSTVASVVASPVAYGADPGDRSDGGATSPAGLRGLRLPDRVMGVGSHTASSVQPSRLHTVREGESLWLIADRLLPAQASLSEVDEAWRQLYRSNRSAIGPNPDLIHPGEKLLLAPLPGSSPRTGGTP